MRVCFLGFEESGWEVVGFMGVLMDEWIVEWYCVLVVLGGLFVLFLCFVAEQLGRESVICRLID